jgi:hypothetical protein
VDGARRRPSAGRQRHLSREGRSASYGRLDLERPADESEALAHADKAERLGADLSLVEPASVVVDRRSDRAAAL